MIDQAATPEIVEVGDFLDWKLKRQLELLPRASCAKVTPYWERIDLYYATELWERGSAGSINWRFRARARVGPTLLGTGTTRSAKRYVPNFLDDHAKYLANSPTVLSVMAFLAAYHHATASQLCTASGASAATTRTALKKAYEAGLLKRGRFVAGADIYPTTFLWTINDGPRLTAWLRSLTEAQKLAVTCGQPVGAGPNHAKHNMLAVELALRCAEVHPSLQAVFGELLGSPSLLLPSCTSHIRGDVVLVRADGLRIVLEFVQSSKARDLSEKLARWGHILKGANWNTNGLIVVFVSGNRANNKGALKDLLREHATALSPEGLRDAAGVLASPGEVARARQQIHIASWDDWFPASWRVSSDFAALRTAFTADGKAWARVDLAHGGKGGIPFTPAPDTDWLAPSRNRAQVAAVPQWLGGPVLHTLTPPRTP